MIGIRLKIDDDVVYSQIDDDVEIFIELFEYFYFFNVGSAEFAVGNVEPFEVFEAEQYFSDDLCCDLVGDDTQTFEFGAAFADGEKALFVHVCCSDEQFFDIFKILAYALTTFLFELCSE